jgi:branched-chain amino acid transport system substrate-binding protein
VIGGENFGTKIANFRKEEKLKGGFKMKVAKKMLVLLILMVFGGTLSAQEKAKPIVIGAPLATAFLYGWAPEKAMKLALEEINKAGGVNVGGEKRPLRLEVIDTRDLEPGVPVSEALLAVEKLILEKKVDFLVGGPVRSEAALASMDLVSKYGKIQIFTTGVLTPLLHQRVEENYEKYKYTFRNTSHSGVMAQDLMTVMEGLKNQYGLKNIMIMVQDVEHARKGGELIAKMAKEKGFEVIDTKVYPTGTTDYSVGLNEAKAKGAQILFLWMDMPESAILLKQWADMKVKALPMGFVCAAEQPGFYKATGGKGEYLIVHVVNGGNVPADITPWTMKFVEAYKKKWGLEPEGYGTASSYMAIYQLKAAIENAGTLETDKVIKALEELDIMGVYGRMRFDKRSHQIIPSHNPKEGAVPCIFQWQKDRRVQVFPESVAKGKIILPPWMR